MGETSQVTKNTPNLCQLTKTHITWFFLHFLQSQVVLPPWRELSSSMLMTTSFSVTKSLQIVLKSAKWPWYIWRLTRANFVMMPTAAVCRGRGRGGATAAAVMLNKNSGGAQWDLKNSWNWLVIQILNKKYLRAMTGNGNYVNIFKLALKNSWNRIWQIFSYLEPLCCAVRIFKTHFVLDFCPDWS